MMLVQADTAVSSPSADQIKVGLEMYALIEHLFPLCRSITGPGVRATLAILQDYIPLTIHEIPTGTQAFDWVVPREWQIRDAYIKAPDGQRVLDFQESNLHVVSYSTPVRARMTWSELQPYLHTLPNEPDWIPYRTSYYQETWGFCLSQCQWQMMKRIYGEQAEYEVCIDSTLEPGSLTYGELLLPGSTTDEVVFSCHVCHPSLANDNLSGIAVATELARHLAAMKDRRYSYRFLFIPGTIGAITWLAQNEANLGRIRHGLVLSLLGIPAKTHYKRSRRGNAEIDLAAEQALRQLGADYAMLDFEPYGYDERQYCSPGLNLPFGCLSRTPYGRYGQYHSSADNLDLVQPEALAGSLAQCATIIEILEGNGTYVNLKPQCEPQLGRRGLYSAIGGGQDKKNTEMALLWVLNQSDGQHSLLDIAARSGLPFQAIRRAADLLLSHQLLTGE